MSFSSLAVLGAIVSDDAAAVFVSLFGAGQAVNVVEGDGGTRSTGADVTRNAPVDAGRVGGDAVEADDAAAVLVVLLLADRIGWGPLGGSLRAGLLHAGQSGRGDAGALLALVLAEPENVPDVEPAIAVKAFGRNFDGDSVSAATFAFIPRLESVLVSLTPAEIEPFAGPGGLVEVPFWDGRPARTRIHGQVTQRIRVSGHFQRSRLQIRGLEVDRANPVAVFGSGEVIGVALTAAVSELLALLRLAVEEEPGHGGLTTADQFIQ